MYFLYSFRECKEILLSSIDLLADTRSSAIPWSVMVKNPCVVNALFKGCNSQSDLRSLSGTLKIQG